MDGYLSIHAVDLLNAWIKPTYNALQAVSPGKVFVRLAKSLLIHTTLSVNIEINRWAM
jgi:hypothetical protein